MRAFRQKSGDEYTYYLRIARILHKHTRPAVHRRSPDDNRHKQRHTEGQRHDSADHRQHRAGLQEGAHPMHQHQDSQRQISYIDLFRCLAYNTYCNRVRLQWMRFRMDSALSGLQPKPNPRTSENRSSKLDIEWNITKFVIEQEGNFLARFEPAADMAYVETCVKALL